MFLFLENGCWHNGFKIGLEQLNLLFINMYWGRTCHRDSIHQYFN